MASVVGLLGVLHWSATHASYELFCVILILLGLDSVLVVLVGRAVVVDDLLASLVIVLEMVG